MATVTETITASTSWVAPTGVTHVDLEEKGGGGGGGAGDDGTGGTGGGEASTVTHNLVPVTAGTSYPIVVGTGGAGGNFTDGAAGGDSSAFGYTASGGAGGGYGDSPYVQGTNGAGTGGGAGGAAGSPGGDATGVGAGGGGGGRYYVPTATPGGDGYRGYVKITYDVPDIAFSSDITESTAPDICTFTASASESPTAWSWDFGDGGSSSLQNPTHEYTVPGSFTVALTVTNAYCVTTLTKTAYIAMYWEPVTHSYVITANPRRGA